MLNLFQHLFPCTLDKLILMRKTLKQVQDDSGLDSQLPPHQVVHDAALVKLVAFLLKTKF